MWKGRTSLGYILIVTASVGVSTTASELKAQENATCVEWGEAQPSPQLGVNTRLLRDHSEPDCMQPDWASWRYDWSSSELRRDVADLKPTVLRFPGGTVGNYWWWTNESRQIIGDDGNMRQLDMCEASTIGLSQSQYIGCNGANLDFTADSYEAGAKKTTITLESYKDAVTYFREEENLNIQEMFMISLLDPFYYLGSPHLEAITDNGSYEVIRDTILNNAVRRANLQLDKIMEVYCGGCESIDNAFDFELGNEYYLQRYGKFFPRPECLTVASLCGDCLTDVNLYADICEQLIPVIRQKFPNAKIAMSGSRDLMQTPWNQVLIDRFGAGAVQIDAAVFHFYPEARDVDSLNLAVCKSVEGSFDPDRILHYQQKSIQDLFDQKQMSLFEGTEIDTWITEFNNYDFSDNCSDLFPTQMNEDDFVFDSGNWLHSLSIMNLFNEFIAFRSHVEDPWMNSSKRLELNKLCMQVMYGNNRVAAIRDDRKLSAQGMSIETLMSLTNSSSTITRLMIGPSGNFTFDGQGDWQPAAGLVGPLPYHFNLDYINDDDQAAVMPTWDAYGFKFQTAQGPKVLIVNLKAQALTLDMSHVESFEQGAHFVNRSVNSTRLGEKLTQEHASPQIEFQIGEMSSAGVNIPPYSICMLDGISFTATGLEEEYAFSEKDIDLYPNPAQTEVTVRLNTGFEQVEFRMMDVTGKVLADQRGSGPSNTFDVQSLQNGMYFMEVQVGALRKMKPFVVHR